MDAAVREAFTRQVDWCRQLGSPFTAALLEAILADATAGGPAAALLAGWPGDPVADALPLRMAGALHALVLKGADPALAAVYPGGGGDPAGLAAALRPALVRATPFIQDFMVSPPQTNEVGRSAVLLPGFLRIAELTELPLATLEIGASAGLNMAWDRYRYRLGADEWGDPAAALLLAPVWRGPPPPLAAPVRVAERAACDLSPVELADPEARMRLRAYVWADQAERLARLDRAIATVHGMGLRVERADAATWLQARLARPAAAVTTVIYHSIMWHYMPKATRQAITATIETAGQGAARSAPVAWLRFEPPEADQPPELHLTLWPGPHHEKLARAQAHGRTIDWLAPASS